MLRRILKFLTAWFQSKQEPRKLLWHEVKRRTTQNGVQLTPQEFAIIGQCLCPDCGSKLLKGPEGGGSVNVYCANDKDCGSRYNLMGWIGAERINDSRGSMTLVETFKPHRTPATARSDAARSCHASHQ